MHGLSFPSTITPVLVRHNIQEPELVIISLRRIFSHSIYYYLLYALAFLFTLGLGWYIAGAGHEVRSLPVRDYNVFRCELGIDADKPVLRVLDVVYLEDWDATNSLCHSQGLKQFYSALELRSVHRDHFDIRELYESHYDLVLAKPELIAGGLKIAQGAIDYQEVARYPSYGSQLVSLAGTPELRPC